MLGHDAYNLLFKEINTMTHPLGTRTDEPVDEQLREFTIWLEGYLITGGGGGAVFEGTWKGKDFRDAVLRMVKAKGLDDSNFNEERLSYWGCRYFDNEADARRTFG